MRSMRVILAVILSVPVTALASPVTVPLKYQTTYEILKEIKESGNSSLLSAVQSLDPASNAIVVEDKDAQAVGLKKEIAKLDVKPEMIYVSIAIKQNGKIIARPSVLTVIGKKCAITEGDDKDKIEIEITSQKVN